MNKKLKTAVLFEHKFIENLELMIPVRVLIGKTDKKCITFYDYINQKAYLNSDLRKNIDYSFNLVCDLNDKFKKYKIKDITKMTNLIYSNIEDLVFFYENDSLSLEVLTIEEFKEMYGINIAYSIQNDLTDSSESLESSLNLSNQAQEDNFMEIDDVYNKIKNSVISQDHAIKNILIAIYKNIIFDNKNIKTNLLLYGPSGVGKTEILRQIESMLQIPIIIEDINRYTVAGYKGQDIEDMLIKLYNKAGGNLQLAQMGVLCIDEIDKKCSTSAESEASYSGVYNSLLKLIEGGTFDIVVDEKIINFDTSNLTIIASGAFERLNDIKNKPNLGFERKNDILNEKVITTSDFVNYGIPKEFIGRFSSIVKLNNLTKEDLKKIFLTSDLSSYKIYREQLKKINIEFELNELLVNKLIDKAYNEQIGARALNRIFNSLLQEPLFDVFSTKDDEPIVLELDDNILENKMYTLKKNE